jgi:hypothetical protein
VSDERVGTRPEVLLVDTYEDEVDVGAVLGGGPAGVVRGGRDVEGRIGVDNGAARLKPLARPGWGREGLSYGPFPRRSGLTAQFQVLNGHHGSQTFYLPETRRQTLRRWLGRLARGRSPLRPRHFENLAVGLFRTQSPVDPIGAGHGLVVHASTVANGELWAGVAGRAITTVTGLQNIPLALAVVLRERGALYLGGTLPEDPALPAAPMLRPLAIDAVAGVGDVHAGVHQRILGEVGYRVDTRVYRTEVSHVPEWSDWCTTAVAADRLTGDGPMAGRVAERGGAWTVEGGDLRLHDGAVLGAGRALLATGRTVGLLHVEVALGRGGSVTLLLRADREEALEVRLDVTGARLCLSRGGRCEELARSRKSFGRADRPHAVQVLDDGSTLSVHVDGVTVLRHDMRGGDMPTGDRVGFAATGEVRLRDLEAHPDQVAAPGAAPPSWPAVPSGERVEIAERFDGPAGPLDGSVTSGGLRWQRLLGQGRIDLIGGAGAKVRASPDDPNPGRTVYGLPWPHPGFVDVTAHFVPPGTARGQRHNGRAGIVLWQDEDNFVVVNVWLDDWLVGSSLSSFYRINGHEDMYDAVWTLTGLTINWGVPCTLRVRFDGWGFLASVDGRPVLYRAVRDVYPHAPRLRTNWIGIVANEEWGDDTGSVFTQFEVASREEGLDG